MKKDKKEWFGLQEQMGLHQGLISRTQKMTQAEADKINRLIDCIKWVKTATGKHPGQKPPR